MKHKKSILLILDGFGLSEELEGNAIKLAHTPTLDYLFRTYPNTKLNASGLAVGLPENQMGNSEVGHLNIGAGRVVYQELTRITKSIQDKDFFKNQALLTAIDNAKQNNSELHLFGLLSDGGVHSHSKHLYALLELAKQNNFERVYIHVFLDGRDTSPHSGKNFVLELEDKIKSIGVGQIASIMGRYYAMDRDNRWERVELAYRALVNNIGEKFSSALDCIEHNYKNNITDEFIAPSIILDHDLSEHSRIKINDSVIFFNFRPDRAREITRTFCDANFNNFERKYFDLTYVCFTEYDASIKNKLVAYRPERLKNTLGEYISSLGLKQLRLAETEKYAHVTFFFNGGAELANPFEDRILIASPKVATYDLQPEMSAHEITDKLIEQAGNYYLTVVNFANCDMVGHTGNLSAAITAVQDIDSCLAKIYKFILAQDINLLICSDHGNSDHMIDLTTEELFTAHTTNPVPFVLINCGLDKKTTLLKNNSALCDIAPTLLKIMNITKPKDMTGESVIL